ncbi:MAG TPA: hypothetical protein VGR52_00660 [Stellaceae bacterium]|nr:hypothetical protein [Stellaceae bacterium]
MTNLLKNRAAIALVPVALILAACAQQPLPPAQAAPMGMQSGANDQTSRMNGMMMEGGADNQMAGMNRMMQMSQMMDRCNAMMQHDTMHSSGAGDGEHQQ